MRFMSMLSLCAVAVLAMSSLVLAEPKHEMEDIMKKGMKGDESLLTKVTSGKGTADDLKLLQEYIHALAEHKPEKGDEASWKKKTGDLVKIVDAAVKGNKKALPELKKAANCKACHSVHKP